jgi:hypothetical protein
MKNSILIFSCVLSILIITSCKKNTASNTNDDLDTARKIKFTLYTDKDFSADNNYITFKLSIQKPTNQVLWDSILPPMRIKDIPDYMHKLSITRSVPNNDGSELKVAFYYSIENVGNSWYIDTSDAGQKIKEITFNFQ